MPATSKSSTNSACGQEVDTSSLPAYSATSGMSWEEFSSARLRQAAQGSATTGDLSPVQSNTSRSMVAESTDLREFRSPMQTGFVSLGDLASDAYFGCNRVDVNPHVAMQQLLEQRDPTATGAGGRNLNYQDLHATIQRVLDIVSEDEDDF